MNTLRLLPGLLAATFFLFPSPGFGRDSHRDHGRGDWGGRQSWGGHDWNGRRGWGDRSDYRHHFSGRYYRPYYRSGYPYSYYGYGYPDYYPYGGFGLSFSTRPYYSSYSGSPIYRGRALIDDSDSLAADVQRELKRRGYYRGAIDGDIGPASRTAIRAYQAERGMRATGRIDSSLLRSLDID